MASNILYTRRFTNKILVDGIFISESESEVKKYFNSFGLVREIIVIRELLSAFAFITFESVVTAESVDLIVDHKINGRAVSIQKVNEFPVISKNGLLSV
jgi:RNA recognition motif-containing protein